ncbi:uncharacterized protein OCT59_028684 [Rhizophagus irregularis]|nr:hypothetical protein OCT59_028684 [Rhizophagus irregularis]GBC52702.2 hypothetical protein GLOIN_2v1881079 [Rhizophagus irregularis DAOM 181602=DAOM 197198]
MLLTDGDRYRGFLSPRRGEGGTAMGRRPGGGWCLHLPHPARRLRFKQSEPMVVVYKDENMENMVKKVLGHIAWLLEEVQKPDSASQSEERSIKKSRSKSKLTGKTDSVDKS